MKNIGQFVKSVRVELSKVTWPNFAEFIGSTIIVLMLLVLFSLYFGVIDGACIWFIKSVFRAFGAHS